MIPDDLMLVSINLTFNAKSIVDDHPIDVSTEFETCLPAEEETAAYLRSIADAIDEGRLFGFMQQESASCPVNCGEWVERTVEDQAAEMRK
jgi:hypothetical protein